MPSFRALDLVSGMVTKKNLVDIVRILMDHVTSAEGNFRTTLVDKIIEVLLLYMCPCFAIHGTPALHVPKLFDSSRDSLAVL